MGSMAIAASAVKGWIAEVCPDAPLSRIATQAGMSRITLHQQLVRGNVPEKSVVAVARSLGLSPLGALAGFEPYTDLRPSRPDSREVLAFVDWPELLKAIASVYRGEPIAESDLGDPVFPDSSRVWVDAIDAGNLRRAVEEEAGLTSSNVAGALRTTLKVPLAVCFARNAGTPLASAFVVSGLLTPMEAGWDADERVQALLGRSPSDLLRLVGVRAGAAEKHVRRIRQFEVDLG
jgi:hypothetical protein